MSDFREMVEDFEKMKLPPQEGICPDSWVVIEVVHGAETFQKIISGWSGGFLDGDSWRMSSPIKTLDLDINEDYIVAHTESGSVYTLYKEAQGFKKSNAGIYNELKERFDDMMRIVDL